jgi:4-hydroxybenzoate polyprenyltransferase
MLTDRYGARGFTYAGNDASDLPIWNSSAAAIVVSAGEGLSRRIEVPVELEIPRDVNSWRLFIRAIRAYQWVKNVLVFLPLVAANALLDLDAVLAATGTFAAFCLTASGGYLLNDLLDLEADRRHQHKRRRPFASGGLSLALGLSAVPIMLSASVVLAYFQGPLVVMVLLAYFALSVTYSAVLKTLPVIDVFVLAALYTIRVIAGGLATGIVLSIWLLSFSGFLFLSLGFLKRMVEVSKPEHLSENQINRRDYYTGDTVPLMMMGVSGSFAATVVLALYVNSSVAETTYTVPEAIWGLVPLSIFWQCRIWLSAARGYVTDDPIVYAAKDWVSWVTLLVAVGCYIVAHLDR